MKIPEDLPTVIAHRGGGANGTENSLEAIQQALRDGCRCIETDLRMLVDGTVILFHDEDLQRLAGDSRQVSQLDLEEIRRLMRPKGTVVTINDILSLVDDNIWLNLDFKDDQSAQVALPKLKKRPGVNYILGSFSGKHLKAARELRSAHFIAGICQTMVVLATTLIGLGSKPRNFDILELPLWAMGPRFVRRFLIRRLKARGIPVYFWVINDEGRMRQLLLDGAAGIITDDVELLTRVVLELGLKP